VKGLTCLVHEIPGGYPDFSLGRHVEYQGTSKLLSAVSKNKILI